MLRSTILISLTLSACGFIMPFYYPMCRIDSLPTDNVPFPIKFNNLDLVGYKKNNSLIVHSDMCPHMGASFAKGGWVSQPKNYLHCPYHGFGFDEGHFVSIPSTEDMKCNGKPMLKPFPTLKLNDYYYISKHHSPLSFPYYPPEQYDDSFIEISGVRTLSCPVNSLVENLLDMLHISYVHSFGNIDIPLARNVIYEELGDFGGKTTFEYSPNQFTISTQFGNTDSVIVENEFYMPTTTLTRVKAGPITKTVYTQSFPVSDKKTILYWKVYRNFWKDPNMESFNAIGDYLMNALMERTIDEDASILSRCYPEGRNGFLTKYDVTIRNYRKKCRDFSKLDI